MGRAWAASDRFCRNAQQAAHAPSHAVPTIGKRMMPTNSLPMPELCNAPRGESGGYRALTEVWRTARNFVVCVSSLSFRLYAVQAASFRHGPGGQPQLAEVAPSWAWFRPSVAWTNPGHVPTTCCGFGRIWAKATKFNLVWAKFGARSTNSGAVSTKFGAVSTKCARAPPKLVWRQPHSSHEFRPK